MKYPTRYSSLELVMCGFQFFPFVQLLEATILHHTTVTVVTDTQAVTDIAVLPQSE